jgi:RND superfamily putative drug exporter
MGSLIGLGVGIDYALFIVNRHRKALLAGVPLREAIAQAVNTSGRAVAFAGATVMIALLGMTILNIGILTGMALGATVTVLLTVTAALTLLPALLAMLGNRVLSRKQRRALGAGELVKESGGGLWGRWATALQRRRGLLGVVAAALVVLLAAPVATAGRTWPRAVAVTTTPKAIRRASRTSSDVRARSARPACWARVRVASTRVTSRSCPR